MNELDFSIPAAFDGTVRLFPLPNLVLLPGSLQGLHIFEPRYRRMLEDVLADDGLITPALWKSFDKDGIPDEPVPIYPNVCLGKVVSSTRLKNDRFNLMLLGIRRARVIRELDAGLPYRMAEVELIEEICSATANQQSELNAALYQAYQRVAKNTPAIQVVLDDVDLGKIPLGLVTDTIAFSVGLPLRHKQYVLETPDAVERAEFLIKSLSEIEAAPHAKPDDGEREFPPDFSAN